MIILIFQIVDLILLLLDLNIRGKANWKKTVILTKKTQICQSMMH